LDWKLNIRHFNKVEMFLKSSLKPVNYGLVKYVDRKLSPLLEFLLTDSNGKMLKFLLKPQICLNPSYNKSSFDIKQIMCKLVSLLFLSADSVTPNNIWYWVTLGSLSFILKRSLNFQKPLFCSMTNHSIGFVGDCFLKSTSSVT